MSTFDRYVLKIFLKYIVIVQFFTMLISMISSAWGDIGSFREQNATMAQLLKFELLHLPLSINGLLPITIVVASIITVTVLMRSGELLAYSSLGGRLKSFVLPFVLTAIFTASFMLLMDYSANTKIRMVRDKYRTEQVYKRTFNEQGRLVNVWFIDGNTKLVHIGIVDPIENEMRDLTEYSLSDNFLITAVRRTPVVRYIDGEWVFYNAETNSIGQVPPIKSTVKEFRTKSQMLSDLSSISGKSPRQLSLKEISQVIAVMKTRGMNTTSFEMVQGTKYAAALSTIVLVFLVVPMGIDYSRRYSPIKSALVSFAFGGIFWAFLSGFATMGRGGFVPAKVACFSPHVIFLIVGLLMLYRKEKAK